MARSGRRRLGRSGQSAGVLRWVEAEIVGEVARLAYTKFLGSSSSVYP